MLFCVVLCCFVCLLTRCSQRTPLIYAAAGNHIHACEALIAARADVNARDDECRPPALERLNLSDNHVCSLSAAITLRSYGQPYASMLSCASCLFRPTPMLKPKTTGERARLVEPFVCSIVDPCKSLSLLNVTIRFQPKDCPVLVCQQLSI